MSENLFNDFNTSSSSAWKQKIQVDLKIVDAQACVTARQKFKLNVCEILAMIDHVKL